VADPSPRSNCGSVLYGSPWRRRAPLVLRRLLAYYADDGRMLSPAPPDSLRRIAIDGTTYMLVAAHDTGSHSCYAVTVRTAVGVVIAIAVIVALLLPPRRPEFIATVSRKCYSCAGYVFPQTRFSRPVSRTVVSAQRYMLISIATKSAAALTASLRTFASSSLRNMGAIPEHRLSDRHAIRSVVQHSAANGNESGMPEQLGGPHRLLRAERHHARHCRPAPGRLREERPKPRS